MAGFTTAQPGTRYGCSVPRLTRFAGPACMGPGHNNRFRRTTSGLRYLSFTIDFLTRYDIQAVYQTGQQLSTKTFSPGCLNFVTTLILERDYLFSTAGPLCFSGFDARSRAGLCKVPLKRVFTIICDKTNLSGFSECHFGTALWHRT